MDLYELAEQVDSKEKFIAFVESLARDRCEEVELERQKPSSPYGPGARGWENGQIETFLDAMSTWASARSALTGDPMVAEQPSWRSFAMILHSGKFYE